MCCATALVGLLVARYTCSGSQCFPDGAAAMVSGRKLPCGICAVCGHVFKLRCDGRLVVHRGIEAWENT